MNPYENKRVLITGGSSGIGLSIARNLIQQGAHVWILARRVEILEQACQEISALKISPAQQVGIIAADTSDKEQIIEKLGRFCEGNDPFDYVFCSAGITYPGMFADLPIEVYERLMNVNYFGTLNVLKAVVPGMIKQKSGHVILVASLAAAVSIIGYSAYSPTKYAVKSLADTLRQELAPHGIRVSIVFPPDTDTPQLAYENQFKPEITRTLVGQNTSVLSADKVAEAIVKGAAGKRYIIAPDFTSQLFFNLTNSFGIYYPLLDFFLARAWKQIARTKNNGHQQN